MIDQPEYAKAVLEAIVKSKLNSNPTLEKTVISLPIAKITREHREKLSKTAKAKSEQAIKKIRDAESKALRKAKDNKSVSKDLIFNVSEHVNNSFLKLIFRF
jgi:ribosome recycling factor